MKKMIYSPSFGFAALWLMCESSLGATFSVTNTENSGPGSLRQAILDANQTAETDTIPFNIPGSGPYTIRPASTLPKITAPIILDGMTQPGFAGQPIVELDASGAATGHGLHITAGNSTVRGLVINGFGGANGQFAGIYLERVGTNVIEGNFVGIDVTGTVGAISRAGAFSIIGIHVNCPNNRIGGSNLVSRNVISGCRFAGIRLVENAPGNIIQGNFIGPDVTGKTVPADQRYGVIVRSSNNVIGGTRPGSGNIISGNLHVGLDVESGSNNLVQGNFIGTDISGAFALPNIYAGILLESGKHIVGGSMNGAGNVISGNSGHGIWLASNASAIIQGNYIGTDISGRTELGNLKNGIYINGGNNSTIGGATPGTSNTIAFNAEAGVFVKAGKGNALRGNSIFSNKGLGVDLGGVGVAPNDEGDRNMGANNLLNFPELASAATDGSTIAIQGKLNSKTNAFFDLDFYSTQAPDPSGYGEGEKYIGSATITTDANGNANFNVTLPVGHFVTATATDSTNNTSEFSLSIPVTARSPAPKLSVAKSISSGALILSWPASAQGFVLETTDSLSPPVVWQTVTGASAIGDQPNNITVTISSSGAGFYRIRKQ
ncbi:MAG: right-handed parallel beta-helix repeat-containing protein [Verrucomicrobia bacterium]|nr:right-handed parallel beta-helix repeat-containing protein [Verrucomicrobiota bacterium]